MDTIFESLRRALKRVTVNPNQDLENLEERDNEFINQELRTLSEIETKRSLEPNEEEREVIEKMSRKYNTQEARNEAAKRQQYADNYRKRLLETPNKFKEGQWVRFKTSTVPRIPAGSKGVILEVLSPDYNLYLEKKTLLCTFSNLKQERESLCCKTKTCRKKRILQV